ncbi:hypothetical protein DFQ28_000070 [Apophysomyces sp. BC1034]|nr:hypothetical protein DFQ30_006700 [Apophysomyces sp. BC1015]KAG0176738.1 hypothetical protein DFQ29_005683 [Apophysomyces sp. BC1021]KAG0194372.1 hypothetical protein DFQ28_000070 [Apophysomyces sp. BC1034]
MKSRKRSLTRCVQCHASFRPLLWGRESGKGPVCDSCSSGDNDNLHSSADESRDDESQEKHETQKDRVDEGTVCANCRTSTTPLWRRDTSGKTICNACGLYYKLHRVHRPATMMRTVIKRRKRCSSSEKKQQQQAMEEYNEKKHRDKQQLQSPLQAPTRSPIEHKLSFDEEEAESCSSRSSIGSTTPAHDEASMLFEDKKSNGFTLPPLHRPQALPPILRYHPYQRPLANEHVHACHSNLEALRSQRHDLQREVTRLTTLLSDTVAMLTTLDQAIANPTPPGQCRVCPPSPPSSAVEEQQVARSLLSLASSPPLPKVHPSHEPHPRLPPISVSMTKDSSPPPVVAVLPFRP